MSDPTPSSLTPSRDLDPHYDEFRASIRARFAALTTAATPEAQDEDSAARPPTLFTVDVVDLYALFLAALPEALRQENECGTCRRFVRDYGRLVTVDPRGRTTPLLWDPESTPEPYTGAVLALARAVREASISGVFLTSRPRWGAAVDPQWTHLSVIPDPALLSTSTLRSAHQLAAEKREDYRLLTAALEEFPAALVKRATALLKTDQLYRSEKCIGVATWLLKVHEARRSAGSQRKRDNLTWLAVAHAPPGFCHVRSTMIGSLLSDLAEGLDYEAVAARFREKMHPLQYQRPTAAPRKQNIERAEKIVATLRSAGSLDRRFAKLDDLDNLWRAPTAKADRGDGVFAHLKPHTRASDIKVDAPPVVITWTKFAQVVLPTATAIHYRVTDRKGPYLALVTAANPDAPPLLQWDRAEARNPVSWYFHPNGSTPQAWGLKTGTLHPVSAVCLAPHMWHVHEEDPGEKGKKKKKKKSKKRHAHQGKMVCFLLAGATDQAYTEGSGFFPELLKSDYREIRATLEAYAKEAVVAGAEEAEACGVGLHASAPQWWGYTFEVTDEDAITTAYTIDRWD